MKNKKGVIYKRKQEILRELHENKKVLVDDLAKALHVSPITIRRDLDEFQAEGIVERFYGGASLVEGALAEDPSEQDSSDQNQSCKESIAREAAALVTEGDTIFLNSSSTALLLLKYLKGKRVTVITNNGNALHMETDPLIELVLTGGEVNQYKKSMVGDFALQMLRKLRADKCFIGVSGINTFFIAVQQAFGRNQRFCDFFAVAIYAALLCQLFLFSGADVSRFQFFDLIPEQVHTAGFLIFIHQQGIPFLFDGTQLAVYTMIPAFQFIQSAKAVNVFHMLFRRKELIALVLAKNTQQRQPDFPQHGNSSRTAIDAARALSFGGDAPLDEQ